MISLPAVFECLKEFYAQELLITYYFIVSIHAKFSNKFDKFALKSQALGKNSQKLTF